MSRWRSADVRWRLSQSVRSWRRRGALVLGVLVLAGCAAPAPRRVADFPFHTESPWARLAWDVERSGDRVTAAGVAEVPTPPRIAELILELTGIDGDGRVVSRAVGTAGPRDFLGTAPWPFTVRLRAVGSETRFDLRVRDVREKISRSDR